MISRFAPAPTGYLHLGHVLNAIYVWGITRALAGRVLLRIEDHDAQRCRPEYEAALLDDLDWLAFEPDDPPTAAFRAGPTPGRQSDRTGIYASVVRALKTRGLVYVCECSRRDIEAAAPVDGGERRYPGTCADKGLADEPGRSLRVRLAPETIHFDDLRHGPQVQRPSEQCGDLLIRDREGNWSYQFVATVDDAAQQVSLVIRGGDLLASTGRQIQLARLIGRLEMPRFLHHDLIMKSATQKLSKADRDTSVADLRAAGLSAAEVIGRAAHAGGLTPVPRPIPASQVTDLVRPVLATMDLQMKTH